MRKRSGGIHSASEEEFLRKAVWAKNNKLISPYQSLGMRELQLRTQQDEIEDLKNDMNKMGVLPKIEEENSIVSTVDKQNDTRRTQKKDSNLLTFQNFDYYKEDEEYQKSEYKQQAICQIKGYGHIDHHQDYQQLIKDQSILSQLFLLANNINLLMFSYYNLFVYMSFIDLLLYSNFFLENFLKKFLSFKNSAY